jgi:hypothetical protein
LPLKPVSSHYQYIFRNAVNIPYVFTLNNWQQPVNGILEPGVGYYIKYGEDIDRVFSGSPINVINRNNYPVRVHKGSETGIGTGVYNGGWNTIGALSSRVDIQRIGFTAIDDRPAPTAEYTQRAGVWAYRTNMGYQQVSALFPGKGYWIKVNEDGFLNMTAQKSSINVASALENKVAGFDKINVADNAQKNTNIYAGNNISNANYELPPLPPAEMFDVRFSNNNYATNYEDEAVVLLQAVTYPVSVTFENPRANYSVVDPVTGFVYGTVKAGNTENVIINESKANAFKLVAEVVEETFFVNVAQNPVTSNNAEINFGINEDANVSLAIFNSLGNEVAKLELGDIKKGIHNKNINVANLASGSYIVRLIAGNEYRTFMMNVVK